jgi:hypothetical protein
MMKKVIVLSAAIFIISLLSIGIVDNILTLTNDINIHGWQRLVGRWQNSEKTYYEIEFRADGTFVEYYFGIRRSSGILRVSGNTIEMFYDGSNCEYGNEKDCALQMEFDLLGDTLFLIKNGSKMSYRRLDDR